jgi:site-specific DNA-cytosine methylase
VSNLEQQDLFQNEESLQVDSLAKTYPLQDFVKAWTDRGQDSFTKSSDSQMNLNHNSSSLKTLLVSCHLNEEKIWESSSQRWLNGGMAFAGECWTLKTSESHKDADVSLLSQVLETTGDLQKYCLSEKAASGILRRAEKKRQTTSSAVEGSVGVNSFQKSKRAQTVDDDESWVESGIVPTLNVFDSGDSRTTTFVTQEPTLLRMRGGKDGGGKGALVSENKSLTIATGNDQTLFLFEGNRVGDPRVHENVSPSVIARWGTGGNNVPLAFNMRSDDTANTMNVYEAEQTTSLTALQPSPLSHRSQTFIAQRQSNSEYKMDEKTSTLTQRDHKQFTDLVIEPIVRRLTPRECERLQGFPDDWTAGQADSTRYKMMGNAVTVPVVEWIVDRMVKLVVE